MTEPRSILVIQTSFIGDVILATSVLETLHQSVPTAEIDVLVRNGNEALFKGHPFVRRVLVWNKKERKYADLLKLMNRVRGYKYDTVVNLHRFASSGALAAYSEAENKLGFRKNPMSMLFTHTAVHSFDGIHEIERNGKVIRPLIGDHEIARPRLYPSEEDEKTVKEYKGDTYRTLSPNSVWFTKQWPAEKWIELIDAFPEKETIYLLGGPSDKKACKEIAKATNHPNVKVLAGAFSLLQSAALMRDAKMNYVNDSAPLHLATAVNAPVRAIFCSTVPTFGFGPLSDDSKIIETKTDLDCRPCGLHGHMQCPKGHFKCALDIRIEQVLEDA